MVFYPLAIVARCQVVDCASEFNSVWPNFLPLRRSGKILETVQVYHPCMFTKSFFVSRLSSSVVNISLISSDHPGALHYTIHSYDNSALFNLGLHAADVYAGAAPKVHVDSCYHFRDCLFSVSSFPTTNFFRFHTRCTCLRTFSIALECGKNLHFPT